MGCWGIRGRRSDGTTERRNDGTTEQRNNGNPRTEETQMAADTSGMAADTPEHQSSRPSSRGIRCFFLKKKPLSDATTWRPERPLFQNEFPVERDSLLDSRI